MTGDYFPWRATIVNNPILDLYSSLHFESFYRQDIIKSWLPTSDKKAALKGQGRKPIITHNMCVSLRIMFSSFAIKIMVLTTDIRRACIFSGFARSGKGSHAQTFCFLNDERDMFSRRLQSQSHKLWLLNSAKFTGPWRLRPWPLQGAPTNCANLAGEPSDSN